MNRPLIVDAAWLVVGCAVVTWTDGVPRFIGLLWISAQIIDLGRQRR